MSNPCETFGEMVFGDQVMQKRLPKETYKALKRTMEEGRSLNPDIAGVVANAMKDWAIEKGATHYSHWFQPMTGMTAEKHDAFISPKKDGTVLLEFSGKELVRGESDASSFPSGGLRATFEARGYTAWDPTSYAFIKDGCLCIPTAYCSYGGEALDKKTPLLRSIQALSKQATRVVKLFGHDEVTRVMPTVGPEQEYFLVDKALYLKRPDLINCGRTLFGAKPPKGQELDDHFFGAIKPRVQAFMKELNVELWRLGIFCKTEHNEAAPAQHEMAPVFTTTNIAADHNQLTMEMMKRVADRHDLVCLLSEKPYAGVNGSGKHNNWSLQTDAGVNLLEPGDTPRENAQFLLFLTAVIEAVDDYQDMLRCTIASPGNDHRLGANEAPPAIISMFLGEELTEIIDSIISGSSYVDREKTVLSIGVHVLPKIPKDTTDRNRTSPLAFTGNKFEFRSLGASQSISGPNIVLNTAVADSLMRFADALENAEDFNKTLGELIRSTLTKHQRILFNGNNYAQSWPIEAEKRGLLNLRTTVDALPSYIAQKNIDMFGRHKVFTRLEMESRYEIHLENYVKVVSIEALTMLNMARRLILPASLRFSGEVAKTYALKRELAGEIATTADHKLLAQLTKLCSLLSESIDLLDAKVSAMDTGADMLSRAIYVRDEIIPAMDALRCASDQLESIVDAKIWPMPTYQELLDNA